MKKINYIPWREQLDIHEMEALSDEYGWDEFLDSVGESPATTTTRRVPTPLPNFHRHLEKRAAATNWDTEYNNAQSHVRDVLSRLGNG